MDFVNRNTETELMDDPAMSRVTLEAVLNDIGKANRFLGGNGITIRTLASLMRENPRDAYKITDIGCGDGAMLRKVAQYCRQRHIRVELSGVDVNPKALKIAREKSTAYPEIHFFEQDILKLSAGCMTCDIILCTLTMHHFSNKEIAGLLNALLSAARIGVVINDLQRSKAAYYLFKVFSTIFMRTQVARSDGLISIRSGFRKYELLHFSGKLKEARHAITWRWAFRYLWVMRTFPIKKRNE